MLLGVYCCSRLMVGFSFVVVATELVTTMGFCKDSHSVLVEFAVPE